MTKSPQFDASLSNLNRQTHYRVQTTAAVECAAKMAET